MISQSTLVVAIGVSVLLGAILLFRTVQDLRLVHQALRNAKQSSSKVDGELATSTSTEDERSASSFTQPGARFKLQSAAKGRTYFVIYASAITKPKSSVGAAGAHYFRIDSGARRIVSNFEIQDMPGTGGTPALRSPDWDEIVASWPASESVQLH